MKYTNHRLFASTQESISTSRLHRLLLGVLVAGVSTYLVFSKEYTLILRYLCR